MKAGLKFIVILFCPSALFCLAAPAGAAAEAGSSASAASAEARAPLQGLDELVSSAINAWDVPGLAISIVQDGEILLSKGYGIRNPVTGAPVTEDTIFHIASLTKAFTGVGAGILSDDGKLSFSDRVRTYIPPLEMNDPIATHDVTIRDLLSHRSGLRGRHDFLYYRNPQMPPQELVRRLPHLDLHARPGRSYQYSNAAYVIAGLAMEKAAGVPFETFMEERLFQPLRMSRTSFSVTAATADPNHAIGRWRWNGAPVHEYFDGGRIINPHGGISTTASDMASWMIMNLSGGSFEGRQIIRPSTLQEVQRTQVAVANSGPEMVPLGYAMGWGTQIYQGEMMLAHEGGVPGFRTLTHLLPARKIGVTILANQDGSLLPYYLSLQIIDRLLGQEPVDRLGPALASKKAADENADRARSKAVSDRPITARPVRPLGDYVGTYTHAGYGSFKIRTTGGRLTAEYNGHSAPLVHRHYDVFAGAPETPTSIITGRVQFSSDIDGRISSLSYYDQFGTAPFEKQPDERLSNPDYLRTLAGTYDAGGGSKISIVAAGDKLIYQRGQQEPTALVPTLRGDFFHPRTSDLHISFKHDSSGRSTTMIRRHGGGVEEMRRID